MEAASIREEDAVDFEELQLSDMEWAAADSLDDDEEDEEITETFLSSARVNMDGVPLTLTGLNVKQYDTDAAGKQAMGAEALEFYLAAIPKHGGKEAKICIDMNFTYGDGNIHVETGIKREDARRGIPDRQLPDDLGIRLYDKMLDYFQKKANETGKIVEHVIIRSSKLKKERWEELFLPLLRKSGREYINRTDAGAELDQWTGLYYPGGVH
ncbi:MAG: hypothetical protein ABIG66_02920 [Candidatus Kerfeldbacteria bacterium]